MVSPSNASQVVAPAQKATAACGLLSELCGLLMASGVPADILSEIICTVGEMIRGYQSNQELFGGVMAATLTPPRTALVILLMSMVNEKQPMALRSAVLYCFQCFVYRNESSQAQIVQALLPTSPQGELLIQFIHSEICEGWPSGQRYQLACVGTRVRSQPGSEFLIQDF